MKTYELTYIISPEITSEEAGAKAKEIESVIKSKEGTILKQSNPIAKTLSYPIKKRASGFFGVLEFQLEPELLSEVKTKLEKDVKVSRHMLIIKIAAEFKKERRTKERSVSATKPVFEIEKKVTASQDEASLAPSEREEIKPSSAKVAAGKEKVELKDIEHELDEILGE